MPIDWTAVVNNFVDALPLILVAIVILLFAIHDVLEYSIWNSENDEDEYEALNEIDQDLRHELNLLKFKNLIASREANTAQANLELAKGGWLSDHAKMDQEIVAEMNELMKLINEEVEPPVCCLEGVSENVNIWAALNEN